MRWDGHFKTYNFSDVHIDSAIGWNFTGCRSNKNGLCHGHRERSANAGSICSFSNSSSVLARGHWRCTEDYSTVRGSSNSAFEGRKTIDKIIHQETSNVEQKVRELQVKVGDLMIVIVDHVTLKDEEDSKATVVKTAEGIEQDIKELLRCGLRLVVFYGFLWDYSILGTINEDLSKISAQNRWVIAVYKQPNMNALDECMNRLSNAMQKFTVCIWTNDVLGLGD